MLENYKNFPDKMSGIAAQDSTSDGGMTGDIYESLKREGIFIAAAIRRQFRREKALLIFLNTFMNPKGRAAAGPAWGRPGWGAFLALLSPPAQEAQAQEAGAQEEHRGGQRGGDKAMRGV